MKTKKSIWSIALILVLALVLVLGLGFGASRAVVKADPIEDIDHITFDITVDGFNEKTIESNYQGLLEVRYTVTENTGVDAMQLRIDFSSAFTLERIEALKTTSLGEPTINNGTAVEPLNGENYVAYTDITLVENNIYIGANIVYEHVNNTYSETGDVLIIAYYRLNANPTEEVYPFGFWEANSGNEFSNAWKNVATEEQSGTHTPVIINYENALVYIMGDYEFTLAGGEKVYDGIAAANSAITVSDNNNENRPTLNYVWFQGVSSESNTYTKLDSNPVNAGQYFVVLEYEATNRYRAYKGYQETTEGSGVYTLDSTAGKVATYIITQRPITIKIDDQTSVYGEAIVDPLTYAITSGEVLEGDVLGVVISTDATSSSDVGTYSISGMYNNSNYSVVFTNGTYTITKKAITITALDQSAPYTGSEPTVDQSKYSVDPDIQITGVVITKATGVNPGNYVLTPSFNNSNYEVTLVNGTFTITKNALTQQEVDALVEAFAKFYAVDGTVQNQLTITNHAGSYGKTYDAIGAYIGVVLENNAKLSNNVEYKINDGNYTSIEAILANFADYAKTNAGVYEVKINFMPGFGYAFEQNVDATYTITLTIAKAELTITASAEVEYDDIEPFIWVDQGNGWVNGENYETYDEELEMNLEDYVGSNYTRGQNAGTSYIISWNDNAEAYIESVLTNYDVTLAVAQNLTVAKQVVDASDYAFAGYEGVYDGAEHALAVGSAEDINANFDIVNIAITSKSSVKDVADTGAYTATITLKNPNNYTFENGDNDGWEVDENGYAVAAKTAQVTITAATLTINVDYTKTTATFTLEGFVGDDAVADMTNLAYLADGANTNINGNVYTINGYVANAIAVSATTTNTNYTITGTTLRNIVKVEYAAGEYDADRAGMTPVLPETEVFFAGFTADEPQAVALNHYTFVRFATDANNTAAFDFAQAVNENKVVYAIWEENEKYTLTLYYMVEGDVETLTKITELQFYSDSPVNYNELPVVAQKAWFKVQKWFNEEALETKFVDGSLLAADKSIYANYKFNIGLGDVNANGKVNANDITLYRQWIVGGYTMQVVENGKEWETVNSQDFDAENTIYFVKRVADSNALTAESLELGDSYFDIRDVSTIRMGMVGGYGFSIMEGKFVDGEELIVTRTVSADNASDLLILAKSGVAVQLAADITEEDFVGAIENAAKDIIIDLNGHTITVKSLSISLAANNTGKIEIKNGRINVADGNGVHLSAPAGSIVLDNVTLYDRDGEFNLQAADHSLHFYNVVKFLKYNAENVEQPLAAEVKIEKDTHVVVEQQATVEVAKIVVTENFVPSTEADVEITLSILGEQEIVVEGNAKNVIATVADLIEAAANGGEYKLIDDIAYNGTVAFAKDTVLDLNGHTLRSGNSSALAAVEGAKLTINGNGNVYAQEVCVLVLDGSKAEINGGTFTSYDNFVVGTNGTAGRGENVITINGGVFNGNIQTAGYVACGIYVANNDTVVVNGGTFNVTNGVGILARSGNTTVGANAQFNVTGNVTGKVGDSRVVVPAGEVLVVDYAANYPGGDPVLVNNNAAKVYALIDNQASFIDAKDVADTIILGSNIVLDQQIVITRDLTLDLNGKTISNQTDIWSGVNWSLISVQNGTLTVTGNGKMIAKENDCYAFDVRNVGTKLVIENGEFVGNVTAVYAHSGELEVNGGKFDILQKSDYNDSRYLLNCYDANYKNGTAKIVVNGGLFCEFDPENNLSEGLNTNYLADKLYVEENNGVYTVHSNVINNLAELETFRDAVNAGNNFAGKTITLNADITLNGAWEPISNYSRKDSANQSKWFAGTFDGNGHTISGLTNANLVAGNITEKEEYTYGLFGSVNNAVIKNLTLTNVSISASNGDSLGALVGYYANGTQKAEANISNITVSGVVSGADNVGGVVGRATGTYFKALNMTVSGTVTANYKASGIVGTGNANEMVFENCTNNANVSSTVVDANAGYNAVAGISITWKDVCQKVVMTGCVNNGTISTVNANAIAGALAVDYSPKTDMNENGTWTYTSGHWNLA